MGVSASNQWSGDARTTQRSTGDLLALLESVFQRQGFCRQSVADRIDRGCFANASTRPDLLHGDGDLASGFAAAVLELARRARVAGPPRVIQRPKDIAVIGQALLGGRTREVVAAVICDSANMHLGTEIVSEGSVDQALFPVREILNAVLRHDGRAFAVAHNHVDGSATPSYADELASGSIARAASVVGLRFLGHVVVTPDAFAYVQARAANS